VKGRAGIGTGGGSGDAPYVTDGERRERMSDMKDLYFEKTGESCPPRMG